MAGLPESGEGYVVVVGGTNLDLVARTARPVRLATSNPGVLSRRPGGVARNVAENLARLGRRVELVSAVGTDPWGVEVLRATADAGVGVGHVLRTDVPTGTYSAVIDADGELVVAVADMVAAEAVDDAVLRGAEALITTADLLVADGNLTPAALATLLDLVAGRVPVVLDPVSAPKAARLATVLGPLRPVHTLTPAESELADLTGGRRGSDGARLLHDRGVTHVWLRRGAAGSTLFTAGAPSVELAAAVGPVVDVTGAGDAGLAAYAHALLAGADVPAAAAYGQRASLATVGVAGAVAPGLAERIGPPPSGRRPGAGDREHVG